MYPTPLRFLHTNLEGESLPQTSGWEAQGKDLVDAMLPVDDLRAARTRRRRQQVNNEAGERRERGTRWRREAKCIEEEGLELGRWNTHT